MSSQLGLVRQFVAARSPRAGAPQATVPTIVVAAGKGGVGTSTVATLLAAAMSGGDRSVLLVESGDQLGALHHILGVEPARTLDDLRAGRAEPEELLARLAGGLTLLSAHSPPSAEPLSPAERKLLFRRTTSLYERFDLVIVDAGATVDAILAACAESAPRVLAVTACDRIAVVSTYALIKLLHLRAPSATLELIANRCDDSSASRTVEHLSAACEHFLRRPVTFAGVVPEDTNFASAVAAGLGAVEAAAGTPAADALRRIGERIAGTDTARARDAVPPPRYSSLRA